MSQRSGTGSGAGKAGTGKVQVRGGVRYRSGTGKVEVRRSGTGEVEVR